MAKKFTLNKKKLILVSLSGVLIFIFLLYSIAYKTVEYAVISADVVNVSSRISGKIIELNVSNNQKVKKDDPALLIDTGIADSELSSLKDELLKAQSEVLNLKNEINKTDKNLKSENEKLKTAQTRLDAANSDYVMYKNAYKDGVVTKKDINNATKNLELARSQHLEIEKKVKKINVDFEAKNSKKTTLDKNIEELNEKIATLNNDILNAKILCPAEGVVIDLKNKKDDLIEKQETIFSIIPDNFYVVASVKKDDVKHLKKGQGALIIVESKKYRAKIDDIDKTDSKTGEVLVKILFRKNVSSDNNLQIGQNAKVKIRRF